MAKDNNIPLYVIPYWDLNNIDAILERIFNKKKVGDINEEE